MQNNNNIHGSGNDAQDMGMGIPSPLNDDGNSFQHRTSTPSFEAISDYGDEAFRNGSRLWKSSSNLLNNNNGKSQHGHGLAQEEDEMSSVSAFSVPGSYASNKWSKIFVHMLEEGKKPIIIDRHVEWSGRHRPILEDKLRRMDIDLEKWSKCEIIVTLPNGDIHGAGPEDELILMATYKVTLSNATEQKEEEDENEDKDRTLEEEHFDEQLTPQNGNESQSQQIDPEKLEVKMRELVAKELELRMATIQQQQTDDFVQRLTNRGRIQVDVDFRELALNGENMHDTQIRLQRLICTKGRVFDAIFIPQRCQLPALFANHESVREDVLFQPIVDHLLHTDRSDDVIRNVRIELPEKWPMPSMGANGIKACFKESSDSERKLTYYITNSVKSEKIFKTTFFYENEADKEEYFTKFEIGQAEQMVTNDMRLAYLENSRELAEYVAELQNDSIAIHHRAIVLRHSILFSHDKLLNLLLHGAIHCLYFEATISTVDEEKKSEFWENFLKDLVNGILESEKSAEVVPKILLRFDPSSFSSYSLEKWPINWMADKMDSSKNVSMEVSNEIDVAIGRSRLIVRAEEEMKFEVQIFAAGYIYIKRISPMLNSLVLSDEFPIPPLNVRSLASEWTTPAKITIEGGKWSAVLCKKNGPINWDELAQFLQFGQHLCKEICIRACTACNPSYASGQSHQAYCWSCSTSSVMFHGRCSQCYKLQATCVPSLCLNNLFNELILMASRYPELIVPKIDIKLSDMVAWPECLLPTHKQQAAKSHKKFVELEKGGMLVTKDNDWTYTLALGENKRSTLKNCKVKIVLEPNNKVDLWKRCSGLSMTVSRD